MKKSIFVLILILMSIFANTVQAGPPGQVAEGEIYIVQADDWLSKIAEKFYGDMFAYPTIVEATNAKAAEDSSFAVIENPDLIEIGQKLWIPAAVDLTLPGPEEPADIETEVINYLPAVPTETVAGSCWTSSIASPGSPYAWRCAVDNGIFDPCLTAVDGQTIVCGVPDQEFGLDLTEPLPEPVGTDMPVRPWLLELADGIICSPFTGTLPPIEETAPYGCSDQAVIVGDLEPGLVWHARKAMLEPNEAGPLPYRIGEEALVPILKVWLAGEPAVSGG